MELSQFKAKMEQAFQDVPYPGNQNLTECHCPECTEIADYFQGKTWQRHSVKDLRAFSAALNLFTAEAVHYYLPAFILAELADPEEADTIYDSLIFIFSPSGSSCYKKNIALLSQPQREIMVQYFRYCLAENGEY